MKHEISTSSLIAPAIFLIVLLVGAFYLVDKAAEDRGRFDVERKLQIAEHLENAARGVELASEKEDEANASRAIKNNFDEQLASNRRQLFDATRRGAGSADARSVLDRFHALGFKSATVRSVYGAAAP